MDPAFDIERSSALDGVAHGFFGSAGGAHQFGYGGPGAGEDIARMRATAAQAIVPGACLVTPHQVHSSVVVTVEEPWADTVEGRPVGDGVVTREPGIVLGIVTADCAPVLFADREAGVIGAAHAGWRGAHGGVLENTLDAMAALGARLPHIAAAIGPTIAQASYEVDEPFRANFTDADALHFKAGGMREGRARWRFDLPGYIVTRLSAQGLDKIHDCARDTFPHPERYHSYRRASLSGEPDYGRMIALIAL
jgi:YfiH family protein